MQYPLCVASHHCQSSELLLLGYLDSLKRMKNKELYMLYILGRSVINNDELCEAWGNKIKEIYCSSLGLKMISFVSFPQASVPSINFNISKLV